MGGSPQPYISKLWRTSLRPSGVSLWGERPTWIRHVVYWAIAFGTIAITAFDRTTTAGHFSDSDVAGFAWTGIVGGILAVAGLVFTLWEWEQISATRNISRSLVLFTFLLGYVAAMLSFTGEWGVHIEACRTVGELETCQGQASGRQVLGMLAWHAANVVPGLDIPHSLEWPRPARSTAAIAGASILIVRLWVVIGILGVFKRLWDKWGPSGSNREEHRPAGWHG
jgi:hypothetical protein